jgi:hypothetical protein
MRPASTHRLLRPLGAFSPLTGGMAVQFDWASEKSLCSNVLCFSVGNQIQRKITSTVLLLMRLDWNPKFDIACHHSPNTALNDMMSQNLA